MSATRRNAMTSRIRTILTAPNHGDPQAPRDRVELRAGKGLIGDRHAGKGIVSLIEQEAVDAFNEQTGLCVDAAAIGRNIVTEGIALNDLVGKRFNVGQALLECTELCDPCAELGRRIAEGDTSPADVVRLFVVSGGIRARVITGAVIAPGDEITQLA